MEKSYQGILFWLNILIFELVLNKGFCFVSDSSNSGGENMYTMMKPVPGGNMPGVSSILHCF